MKKLLTFIEVIADESRKDVNFIIGKNLKLSKPTKLKAFISQDEMEGLEDFLLMMKDEELCKRIPLDVRAEYEKLVYEMEKVFNESIRVIKEALKEMEGFRKESVHKNIQRICDEIQD